MTQLEHDLLANAHERFKLWIKDTVMRFEAADLPKQTAIAAIFSVIADNYFNAAEVLNLPTDREKLLRRARAVR